MNAGAPDPASQPENQAFRRTIPIAGLVVGRCTYSIEVVPACAQGDPLGTWKPNPPKPAQSSKVATFGAGSNRQGPIGWPV